MKHILLQGFFLLASLSAFSQISQNVLYLKNGGVLRGVVLKGQDSSQVKIETIGGNVFVVDREDIEKETVEPAPSLRSKGIITSQPDGIYHETSFGLPFGLNQYGWFTTGVTLNYVLGYQYKRNLKFGIGSGIDHYGSRGTMLPLFLRITGDLASSAVTPTYIADLGYGSNISMSFVDEEHKGGLLLFLGAGFKINTRRAIFYHCSAGYKTQFSSSHFSQSWLEEPYSEYRQYNRAEFRFSVGF